MKFTSATFTKRSRFNQEQYEHEELTMSMALDEEDDAQSCVNALRSMVSTCLTSKVSDAVVNAAEKKVKEVAKETPKEEPPKKEEPKKAPASRSKGKGKASDRKKVKEEVSAEEVKETFKGTAPKATIKYSRDIPEHRQDLAGLLSTIAGEDWRKDPEKKAVAAKLSKEILPGEGFKDVSGTIVPSFVKTIKEAFGIEESEDL